MPLEKQITYNRLNNTYWRTDKQGNGNLLYIDEIWYSSIVQYYYANKYSYDSSEVEKIMKEHDTRKLIQTYKYKNIPQVKYDEWKQIFHIVLIRGMYCKLEQNIEILKELMDCSNINSIKDGVYIKICEQKIFLEFEGDTASYLEKIKRTYSENLPITLDNPQSRKKQFLTEKLNEYQSWQIK